MVASSRFVYDVLWLNKSTCAGCLQAAIPFVYTVPFEIQPAISEGC